MSCLLNCSPFGEIRKVRGWICIELRGQQVWLRESWQDPFPSPKFAESQIARRRNGMVLSCN